MEQREASSAKMGSSDTFYALKMIEHESKNEKKKTTTVSIEKYSRLHLTKHE